MATGLNQARAQVERTLKLCDSETADALIGSPQPDEYGTLVRGTRAAYIMLWMLARTNGMEETQVTLKMGAQALTILLTIVHYAYALGLKRGRESG
jgi:hypothetical protein